MADALARFQELLAGSVEGSGASLELLLATLRPQAARLLRACAIPHHFTPEILRILDPDLSSDEAGTLYEEFYTLSVTLILEGRLALHDEARHYLFGQWLKPKSRDELSAISQRLSDYFTTQASEAQGLEKQTLERHALFHRFAVDPEMAFSEFTRQWTKDYLQGGLSSCKALLGLAGEYREILPGKQLVWLTYYEAQLADELGHFDRASELLHRLRDQPDIALDSNLQIKVYSQLAMLARKQKHLDWAIDDFRRALSFAEQEGDEADVRAILYELGVTYRENGELDQAETWLQKSFSLAEEEGDPATRALVLNGLGNLYLDMRETKKAIATFNDALQCLDQAGDRFRMAGVYNNLGKAYARQRDWARAEGYYQDSLRIKSQAGDTRGQALSLNNLIQVYWNQSKRDEAIKVGNDAARLFREIRDYHDAAIAKQNVGRLYRKAGDRESFQQAYREAGELFKRAGEHDQLSAMDEGFSSSDAGIPWWAWGAVVFLLLILALFVLA